MGDGGRPDGTRLGDCVSKALKYPIYYSLSTNSPYRYPVDPVFNITKVVGHYRIINHQLISNSLNEASPISAI